MRQILIPFIIFFFIYPVYPQNSFEDLMKNNLRSVVKILLYDPILEQSAGYDIEDDFMGRGTGFIVSEDGIIFTNSSSVEWCVYGYMIFDYILKNGEKYEFQKLTYSSGLEYNPSITKIYYTGHPIPLVQVFNSEKNGDFQLFVAEIKAISTQRGGAIIQIVSDIDGRAVKNNFKPVTLGNSDDFNVKDKLALMGFPGYYRNETKQIWKDNAKLSTGIYKGSPKTYPNFFYTDFDIHGGNVGGPVFSLNQQVIGIAAEENLGSSIGLVERINGMYIMASPLKEILQKLKNKGLTLPKKNIYLSSISGKIRPVPYFNALVSKKGPMTSAKLSYQKKQVKGIVKSADTGKPIQGIKVALLIYDHIKKDNVIISSGVSDKYGKFITSPPVICEFSYTITLISNGYNPIHEKVFVEKDKNEELKIVMVRKK